MRTIKTYFKGAPFYIASYRNVAFSPAVALGHIPIIGMWKSSESQMTIRRRNIKGRPFWSRVWVLASIPTERNALNG